VRVTAQLIDAIKGHHLWAESYDRELKNVFALQDDITRNVVMAMEVKLTAGEEARILRAQTVSAEAYQYVRLGRTIMRRYTEDGNAEAQQLFEKAVLLDSNFSSGWVALGYSHFFAAKFGWGGPVRGTASRAYELARKALAIDSSNPYTYTLLSEISLYRKEFENSIAYGEKAVALSPSYELGVANLGWTLLHVGRPKEALPLIQRAIRLTPYTKSNRLHYLGQTYRLMGRYEEAIAAFERERARKPLGRLPPIWLAITYAEVGRMEEARAMAQEVLMREPKFSAGQYGMALTYKDPTERERIIASLVKAGLPEWN
jgi:adenylate cyclase